MANVTSEGRRAAFTFPLVLGMDMGSLHCQADNGDQTAHSKPMPLHVGMNWAVQLRSAAL